MSLRRSPPNPRVDANFVRTLPLAPGGMPGLFWFESNEMTLSPNVAAVADQTNNGFDLTYSTQATYQAAGGPTGGPAWVGDQVGQITGASLANTPCRNPQTFYAVYYTNPIAGQRALVATNNGNQFISVSDAFTQSKPAVRDVAERARIFGAPANVWYAIRYRWNGSTTAIKYNGNAEVTDAAGVPIMSGGGIYWDHSPTVLAPNAVTQNPTVLIAGFDEDTLASGVDSFVRQYITDTYGLTI